MSKTTMLKTEQTSLSPAVFVVLVI